MGDAHLLPLFEVSNCVWCFVGKVPAGSEVWCNEIEICHLGSFELISHKGRVSEAEISHRVVSGTARTQRDTVVR